MVSAHSGVTDKKSLRQKYCAARAEFAASHGKRAARHLTSHIQRLIQDFNSPGLQVALYRPRADEAQFCLPDVSAYFYPRVEGQNLRFLRPQSQSSGTSFEVGTFGIEEPRPQDSDELLPSKPLLVFCPAVAVDRKGDRLGLGKGFYDRFLNDHPHAIRVAVVYQIQISKDPLHADSWDQPMDWIVTESMILRSQKRSA